MSRASSIHYLSLSLSALILRISPLYTQPILKYTQTELHSSKSLIIYLINISLGYNFTHNKLTHAQVLIAGGTWYLALISLSLSRELILIREIYIAHTSALARLINIFRAVAKWQSFRPSRDYLEKRPRVFNMLLYVYIHIHRARARDMQLPPLYMCEFIYDRKRQSGEREQFV